MKRRSYLLVLLLGYFLGILCVRTKEWFDFFTCFFLLATFLFVGSHVLLGRVPWTAMVCSICLGIGILFSYVARLFLNPTIYVQVGLTLTVISILLTGFSWWRFSNNS